MHALARLQARAKRRKQVTDNGIELSSDFMKRSLALGGTDDITRAAYSKGRKRLSHDMPVGCCWLLIVVVVCMCVCVCVYVCV
jgi:hypothetical protein